MVDPQVPVGCQNVSIQKWSKLDELVPSSLQPWSNNLAE